MLGRKVQFTVVSGETICQEIEEEITCRAATQSAIQIVHVCITTTIDSYLQFGTYSNIPGSCPNYILPHVITVPSLRLRRRADSLDWISCISYQSPLSKLSSTATPLGPECETLCLTSRSCEVEGPCP